MQAGKYILLFLSMLFVSQLSYAQAVQTKEPNYRDAVLDRQFGIVGEVKAKPAGMEGSYYLEESWHTGNVYLTSDDTIKGYSLKYDLERNQMEIRTQQDIKVLGADKITMFEWENAGNLKKSVFVHASFYAYKGTRLTGFYEVLSPGKAQLLSRTSLETMKADYNVALDVGSRSGKIVKKETFFVGKDQTAYEISPKKEEIVSAFGSYASQVIAYAKTNKLKFNKKENLIRIVAYYNTLLQ